jgi:hypothetical protein
MQLLKDKPGLPFAIDRSGRFLTTKSKGKSERGKGIVVWLNKNRY